jgi:glutamate racemase
MKIAIFDSGAGGLSVLNTFLKLNCQANFIYFADTDKVPYGEKSPSLVAQYIIDNVSFLAKKNIDALVIACNTATSLAIDELRNQNKFKFPIFGMEPAVKLAIDSLKNKNSVNILITASAITANSRQLKQLQKRFNKQANFETCVLGELVRFVENNQLNEEKIYNYLNKKFGQKRDFDAVVLGCTHFSFFKKTFEKFFGPKTLIVDGNLGTVQNVIQKLKIKEKIKNQNEDNKIKFYFSKKNNSQLQKKYQDLLKKLD